MDPGLLGFAAIVSVPAFLLAYAMYHSLRKDWEKLRKLEETAKRPSLDRRAVRLQRQAEEQELGLVESTERMEERAAELDRTAEEHGRRLENLEAVVVGQVGSRPHEAEGPAEGPVEVPSPDRKPPKKQNRMRTARLARRLDR